MKRELRRDPLQKKNSINLSEKKNIKKTVGTLETPTDALYRFSCSFGVSRQYRQHKTRWFFAVTEQRDSWWPPIRNSREMIGIWSSYGNANPVSFAKQIWRRNKLKWNRSGFFRGQHFGIFFPVRMGRTGDRNIGWVWTGPTVECPEHTFRHVDGFSFRSDVRQINEKTAILFSTSKM